MKTTTFTEFRRNARAFFDAVEEGETIEVSRHGKVIARVVPAYGSSFSRKSPAIRLKIPGLSLSEMIVEERKRSRS